jgi:hypothetical protein
VNAASPSRLPIGRVCLKERPMDQDASGWKTLLTSANQLVRSATHPRGPACRSKVTCLVRTARPGGSTRRHLTAAEPPRPGRPGQLLDLHLHQLARTCPMYAPWADRYQTTGLVGDRRATPRVRLRARPRQRPPTGQGPGGRLPGRGRQRLRHLDAFDNHYWPALYFVDAQGQIRHHRFGEGDYEMSRWSCNSS